MTDDDKLVIDALSKSYNLLIRWLLWDGEVYTVHGEDGKQLGVLPGKTYDKILERVKNEFQSNSL